MVCSNTSSRLAYNASSNSNQTQRLPAFLNVTTNNNRNRDNCPYSRNDARSSTSQWRLRGASPAPTQSNSRCLNLFKPLKNASVAFGTGLLAYPNLLLNRITQSVEISAFAGIGCAAVARIGKTNLLPEVTPILK